MIANLAGKSPFHIVQKVATCCSDRRIIRSFRLEVTPDHLVQPPALSMQPPPLSEQLDVSTQPCDTRCGFELPGLGR